jgi:hypothetical protein
MSQAGTQFVAVLAMCIAWDTAAGGEFAKRAGALESCRWTDAQSLAVRPPGRVDARKPGTSCVLTRGTDEATREMGEFVRLTPGPDASGRRSDTLHFLSYQGASIVILYALPESVTGWTDEQKENYSLKQWWDHVQNPVWDTDKFYLNYVLHPYWGAAYFVRSRERGYGEQASFWYAAALSASYEFGVEALFENPSIQDLIVTPVGGWLVGRYFMTVRENILANAADVSELPFQQRAVLTLTDPLGAINRTVDGWFGLEQRFTIQPFVMTHGVHAPAGDGVLPRVETEQVYGLTFTYVW